jgi:hypothetical protein
MITHVQHELDTIQRRQQYKSKHGNKVKSKELLLFGDYA